MDESSVRNYIEAGRALQERYDQLRTGLVLRDRVLQEHYKPLLKPLQDIRNQIGRPAALRYTPQPTIAPQPPPLIAQETPKPIQGIPPIISLNIGPLATQYLSYSASKDKKTDKTFGLRIEHNRLMIGNVEVTLNKDDIMLGNNLYFTGTEGLWQLLTLDQPDGSVYTRDDYKNYAKIIQYSNAWRQNNDPTNSKPKASGGYKYKKIIKPMLPAFHEQTERDLEQLNRSLHGDDLLRDIDPQYREGEGLMKRLTHAPVEYKRWNTIDELLEQLYIDIGEIKAGNNSPYIRNDIVDILREIKEEYEL